MIGGMTVITLLVVPPVDRTSHELRSSGCAYFSGSDLRSVTAVGSLSLGWGFHFGAPRATLAPRVQGQTSPLVAIG